MIKTKTTAIFLICAMVSVMCIGIIATQKAFAGPSPQHQVLKIVKGKKNKKKKYLYAIWKYDENVRHASVDEKPVYFDIYFQNPKYDSYSGKVNVKPSDEHFKVDVTKAVGNKKTGYMSVTFKTKAEKSKPQINNFSVKGNSVNINLTNKTKENYTGKKTIKCKLNYNGRKRQYSKKWYSANVKYKQNKSKQNIIESVNYTVNKETIKDMKSTTQKSIKAIKIKIGNYESKWCWKKK